MKPGELSIVTRALAKELGPSWPTALIAAQMRTGRVFGETHWAKETGVEAEFARRLSISTALYRGLLKKLDGDRALGIMRRILVPLGTGEQLDNLDRWGVSQKTGPEKLLAFYDAMGTGGVGQFVHRTITEKGDSVLSFQVRNCLFKRFYDETGTPELTRLFCEVDVEFFAQAFPDFNFHRGSSLENTVAYGKDHCEFVFEKKP